MQFPWDFGMSDININYDDVVRHLPVYPSDADVVSESVVASNVRDTTRTAPNVDKRTGVEVAISDDVTSYENSSIVALQSGHVAIAYEDRDSSGYSQISIFMQKIDPKGLSGQHVLYHRPLSFGTLKNTASLASGGNAIFEIYDSVPITSGSYKLALLSGPLSNLVFDITDANINTSYESNGAFNKHVVRFNITSDFSAHLHEGGSYDITKHPISLDDTNDINDVSWIIFSGSGPSYSVSLPPHLDGNGVQAAVANPSLATTKNNQSFEREQSLYVTYQAFESNKWNVYLVHVILANGEFEAPLYMPPYIICGNGDEFCNQLGLFETQDEYDWCGSPYAEDLYVDQLQYVP
jgi:hypothetical protein